MIKFTQSDVVDLVVEKIKQFGRSKSGTYNRADPTACVSGRASFLLGEESPVEIKFYDGTWGIDFEIKAKDGEAKGYFGRSYDSTRHGDGVIEIDDGGEWHRVENEELFFKCLLNVARASDTDAFEGDPFKYSANTSECTCAGAVCVDSCTSSVMDYK